MAPVRADPPISAVQCRAARALLRWSQEDMAARSGVCKATIAYFEMETRQPHRDTVRSLKVSLERAGVLFVEEDELGAGVCLVIGR